MGFEFGRTCDRIHYTTTELERIRICIEQEISRETYDDWMRSLELEFYESWLTRNLAFRLTAYIAGETLLEETIQYPRDWWEALKERWFPSWALKRCPVAYTRKHFSATAFYPKLKLPKDGPVLKMELL